MRRLTMYHDRTVLQRVPVPLFPSGEQQRTHTGRHTHCERVHRGGDVLHRVVYRQAGRDGTSWRVDVELDGRTGIFSFEEKELSGEEGG